MRKNSVYIEDIPDYWTREKKIQALLPLAKMISGNFLVLKDQTSLDKEDLYSVALAACVVAVDTFKPEKRTSLAGYCTSKIKWALKEAVRTHSHASRTLIDQGKHVRWVNFSSPSQQKNKTIGDFLSEIMPDTKAPHPDEILIYEENRNKFHECLEKLSPRQKTVVSYYIQNNCTLKEIAANMGVSESRVFQLMKESVKIINNSVLHEKIIFDRQFGQNNR